MAEKIIGKSQPDDHKLVEGIDLAKMDDDRNKQIDAAWKAVEDYYYQKSNFGPALVVFVLAIGFVSGVLTNYFFNIIQ